jgi:hypothetical protein
VREAAVFWRRKPTTKPTYEELRAYVVKSIRDFLDGTGGKWDWDDFISIPTCYPDLEAVQEFCVNIAREHPPEKGGWCSAEGIGELRRKIDELERSDSEKGQNPS